MCPDCGKPKMLFESERKANDFIRWNADDLEHQSVNIRAYYCPSCCGWHISHKKHWKGFDQSTDRLIDAYNKDRQFRGVNKMDRLINSSKSAIDAQRIFDMLPIELQTTPNKGTLRKGLTMFLAEKGIADDSDVRFFIYKLWKERQES